MNLRSKTLSIALAILLVSLSSSLVFAQGVPNGLNSLEISLSTNNPTPGQSMTLTAKSYSFNIDSANITWTAGGKILAKGLGVTSISITAPSLGKALNVNISAVTEDGAQFQSSISISSASVDMITESGGFTPPAFLGKAPVAYQNNVKIIAVPHIAGSNGIEYSPSDLVYKWEQNSKVLDYASGYGKQSIVIPGAIIPRPYDMKVTVTSRDGSVTGAGYVTVDLDAPSVNFYKNDPLYGALYNSAINGSIYLGEQRETAVTAVPFGFNAPDTGVGSLLLSWLINGSSHPELSSNRTVTLRAPDGSGGSSDVQLNIKNDKDILQQGSGSFSVIFSGSSN